MSAPADSRNQFSEGLGSGNCCRTMTITLYKNVRNYIDNSVALTVQSGLVIERFGSILGFEYAQSLDISEGWIS